MEELSIPGGLGAPFSRMFLGRLKRQRLYTSRMLVNRFALAVPVLAAFLSTARANPISSIYAFGDSLSDAGNIKAALGYPSAPYVNGHFIKRRGLMPADLYVSIAKTACPFREKRSAKFTMAETEPLRCESQR